MHLISTSVNSSSVSIIWLSDESDVIWHNTFWVAVNISSEFLTWWVHINGTIMFFLRSATRHELLLLLQAMNFFPLHELTFFAWCTLIFTTDSLRNHTSLIKTSISWAVLSVKIGVVVTYFSPLNFRGDLDRMCFHLRSLLWVCLKLANCLISHIKYTSREILWQVQKSGKFRKLKWHTEWLRKKENIFWGLSVARHLETLIIQKWNLS